MNRLVNVFKSSGVAGADWVDRHHTRDARQFQQ